MASSPLVIALPKGRIAAELAPVLERVGVKPEPEFAEEESRKLLFSTSDAGVSLIRVRSFDVPTFVAFGAAQLGIAGSDVLAEFDYQDLYAPLDLGIGKCRLSLAEPDDGITENLARLSHLRVATKYPNIASRWCAARGIQAECIRLSGAMELAPRLHLSRHIVDLVSTGRTLKENGLKESEVIAQVSSRLVINRAAFKTDARPAAWVQRFREAVHGA
ncbi:MAG: ATP phosphoribosyltransferase [Alphaproteobacteria bacterium]|nr:ATP phosphoribosyltransferase [Alphaproteobacteria bacterium]